MNNKNVFCILLCFSSGGSAPQFSNLTADDLRMVMKDFSGNSQFTTVSPASGLGDWGFEIGFTAGVTDTPNIQSLVVNAGGSADVGELPHGGIFAGLTFPYALTGEVSVFPYTNVSGISYSQFGVSGKWTFSDDLLQDWSFDAAIKATYSQSAIAFSQLIKNASTGNRPLIVNAGLTDTVYGADILVSGVFSIFEPYLGLGYLFADGRLAVSGSSAATFFSSNLTGGQSATSAPHSTHLLVGADLIGFWRMVFGLEFQHAFDVNTYNSKVSVQF